METKKKDVPKGIRLRWRAFTRQEKILLPIAHFLLLLIAVWMFASFIFVVLNSFKAPRDYNESVLSFPKTWRFRNYIDAFSISYRNTNVLMMAFNSIFYSVTCTLASIASSTVAAYALAKYKFKGRAFLYSFIIAIQIVPIFGTSGASLLLVNRLGLNDKIYLIWIPALSGFNYTCLIMHSYFKNISWEYAEAAFIDGAGNLYVFLRIMLPMVLPPMFFMGLGMFIGAWNDYMTPLLFLPRNPTLATGIYYLKSASSSLQGGIPAFFAAVVLSCVPIILIFAFMQKTIFGMTTEGGIKG
ncbi:MAG: carbohydrate ABC transporter permease [Clostridiales bacterium]|jgi:raffinose/stachyose/melibiose transport system permease protein/N-acetylglucosamine transport system permease protein|nr:carbohydrate ABC transporter permease [Clostridiales bacterium]